MKIPLYTSAAINGNEKTYSDARRELEQMLKDMMGAEAAVTTDSAASALRSLLYSWSVCKGEAVFVPSFADAHIVNAVLECGAEPVFVDCDRNTWLMSGEKLERAAEKCLAKNELYPRAVIVSNTFGMRFDARKISSVCAKYGLLLIEVSPVLCTDTGIQGDAAAVSLENIVGSDAGVVFVKDSQQARALRIIVGGGEKTVDSATGAEEAVRRGSRSELDDVRAGLLISHLEEIDEKTARRRANAEKLKAAARGTSVKSQSGDDARGSYPVYPLCAEDKDSAESIVKAFREEGIGCRMIYSKPLCRNNAFKELGCQASDVPVGSELSVCTFILPCHEELTDEQVRCICEKIKMICV